MFLEEFFDNYLQLPALKRKFEVSSFFDEIYRILLNKQFRTHSLPEILGKELRTKITNTIQAQKPFYFSVPFGGYKLWKLKNAPHIDFAELFNLIQVRNYLYPISQIYPPGLTLNYWSDEILVSTMNQYPQKDLDCYNHEFENLISSFSTYLPSNFKLQFQRVKEILSPEKLSAHLKNYTRKKLPQYEKISSSELQEIIIKVKRNYYESDWKDTKTLLKSFLTHEAYLDYYQNELSSRFPKNKIELGFRNTGNWGIPVKSSRASYCHFWTGTGVLMQRENTYLPSILTFQQYLRNQNKFVSQKLTKNIFPFKTFKTIEILKS